MHDVSQKRSDLQSETINNVYAICFRYKFAQIIQETRRRLKEFTRDVGVRKNYRIHTNGKTCSTDGIDAVIRSAKLLFANRQEKYILWKQQLDELDEIAGQRFQVFYTISQPTPEWDGYEGRVSTEMLLEILPPPLSAGQERKVLIAVCGPDAFTQHMVSMPKDLSYSGKMIHAFLG